ncbi:MAG: transcription antitermination factor NusB [Anaerolineae bacterium]|nr:transcription antitermination factor NusB [Anaerolineae bacterium]
MSNRPDFEPDENDIQTGFPYSNAHTLSRRIALQVLYESDASHHPPGEVLARQLQERQPTAEAADYARYLVEGVTSHQETIDPIIHEYAPEFPVTQIAVIDRNILRIAVFEMVIDHRQPVGVTIDEAVKLAKIFAADSAPGFINGVLGSLAKTRTPPTAQEASKTQAEDAE